QVQHLPARRQHLERGFRSLRAHSRLNIAAGDAWVKRPPEPRDFLHLPPRSRQVLEADPIERATRAEPAPERQPLRRDRARCGSEIEIRTTEGDQSAAP